MIRLGSLVIKLTATVLTQVRIITLGALVFAHEMFSSFFGYQRIIHPFSLECNAPTPLNTDACLEIRRPM
jgi:hypothetical protein